MFRGNPVAEVEYNRKSDSYLLIGPNNNLVDELQAHEFHSQPQLKTLRHGNGGHRRSTSKVHGGPVGQPSFTWATGAPFATFSVFTIFPEPKPIENAGIRAGEIIAPRGWRVKDGLLRSIYKQQHVWKPGEPMTGDVRHEYGVHAFKTRSDVQQYFRDTRFNEMILFMEAAAYGLDRLMEAQFPSVVFAIGTVAMWGEVIEHEYGYRAEFAKVHSIEAIDAADREYAREELETLRTLYNCQPIQGGQ